MNAFSKRLLILFGGIAGFAACASGLTTVVEYSPWGVPESRRQEYDETLAKWDRRDELNEFYARRSRPVADPFATTHDIGSQTPGTVSSHSFEVRNSGQLPLELSLKQKDPSSEVSIEEDRLAPGQSTRVAIEWVNDDSPGDFERVFQIKTNDPLREELEFTVVGKTLATLVTPDSVYFEATDPAVQTHGNFLVYSQVWEDFQINDVSSDLELFDWHAEPLSPQDPELAEKEATSAWRFRIQTTRMEYGHYAGNLNVSVRTPDGSIQECVIQLLGRVRPPIIFHSKELHMEDGLDLGTMFSGKSRDFHVVVRLRGDLDRPIEVLDVQPSELKAELHRLSTPGNYRLTLTIPADCPMLVFNTPENHGYVSVGDPKDPQFKSWFPVKGAVVPFPK